MAKVYRAFQASLNRNVAIKVLPEMLATDANFLARFRREATVVAGLAHPNILPVYDFGEEQGLLYIVMMYVSGGTLRDRMQAPMDFDTIAKIVSQMADGLDHAHRQGVIHRDIKPSNVLMARSDWPLVCDFGIARLAEQQGLTMTGTGLGTPEYMSPEQGMGEQVDARTDIYSLGVMLYEMLTGSVPFKALTAIGIIHQHIYEPLPLPSKIRIDVPSSFEQIVIQAMAKKREDRFATAADFKNALDEAAEVLRLGAAGQTPSSLSNAPTIPKGVQAELTPTMVSSAHQKASPVPISGTVVLDQSSAASRPSTPPVPVKQRRGVLPWALGSLAVAGGAVLLIAVCLLGVSFVDTTNNPRVLGLLGIPTGTPTVTPTATPSPRPTATPTLTPVPPGGTVYEDNFSDPNKGNWVKGQSDEVTFQNGQLHLIAKTDGKSEHTWPQNARQVDNFALEASITKVEGPNNTPYGVIFRDKGDTNYYFLGITGNGSFEFAKYVNSVLNGSGWVEIIDYTTTGAINKGDGATNVLRVEARGTHFKLFVNNQLVGEADDDFSASGRFGFLVGRIGLHISVSSITVTKL